MEGAVRKIRRNILCCAGALTAAVILSALPAQKVFGAQDPGTYTVTVTKPIILMCAFAKRTCAF